MKNHKGAIATLLTLGLVVVGTLITLGTSLFVSNNNTNLALNSRASTGIFHKCSIDNPKYTTGGYYICSGKYYYYSNCTKPVSEGVGTYCKNMNPSSQTPPPSTSGAMCSGTGYNCRNRRCLTGEIEASTRQCSRATGEPVCCYKGASEPVPPTNTGKLNGPCYATGSRCDTGLKCQSVKGVMKCVTDTSADPIPPSRDDTGGSGMVVPGKACCFEKANGLIYVYSRYQDMVDLDMNLNCAAHSVERSYQAIGPAFVCDGSIQNQTPKGDIDPIKLTDGTGDGGTNDDGFIDDIVEDTPEDIPPDGYTDCVDYGPGECVISKECKIDQGQNYQCVSGRFCCTKGEAPPIIPNGNGGNTLRKCAKGTFQFCTFGNSDTQTGPAVCSGLTELTTKGCKSIPNLESCAQYNSIHKCNAAKNIGGKQCYWDGKVCKAPGTAGAIPNAVPNCGNGRVCSQYTYNTSFSLNGSNVCPPASFKDRTDFCKVNNTVVACCVPSGEGDQDVINDSCYVSARECSKDLYRKKNCSGRNCYGISINSCSQDYVKVRKQLCNDEPPVQNPSQCIQYNTVSCNGALKTIYHISTCTNKSYLCWGDSADSCNERYSNVYARLCPEQATGGLDIKPDVPLIIPDTTLILPPTFDADAMGTGAIISLNVQNPSELTCKLITNDFTCKNFNSGMNIYLPEIEYDSKGRPKVPTQCCPLQLTISP